MMNKYLLEQLAYVIALEREEEMRRLKALRDQEQEKERKRRLESQKYNKSPKVDKSDDLEEFLNVCPKELAPLIAALAKDNKVKVVKIDENSTDDKKCSCECSCTCGDYMNDDMCCDEDDIIINPIADSIDHILFNGPAIIVFWADGTKTAVKCSKTDSYGLVQGLAMSCMKKILGDSYNKMLKETVVIFKYMLDDDNWKLTNVNAKIAELAEDIKNNYIDMDYVPDVLENLLLNRDPNSSSIMPVWFNKVKYPVEFKEIIEKIFMDYGVDLTKTLTKTKDDTKKSSRKNTTAKSTVKNAVSVVSKNTTKASSKSTTKAKSGTTVKSTTKKVNSSTSAKKAAKSTETSETTK